MRQLPSKLRRMTIMNDLSYMAMMFARKVHECHARKYTGNPYVDHLAEVAGIVATVDARPETIAAAWLHDSVEDCGISIVTIDGLFGPLVAVYVSGLSDMEIGNRAERKQMSRDRLAVCSRTIQTIKCADLISNTSNR